MVASNLSSEATLKPQDMFSTSYSVSSHIYKGSSTSVHRCTRTEDNQDFAVKMIRVGTDEYKRKQALREINILRRLSGHKNIIELIDAFDFDTSIYLVFELCEAGDLIEYLENNPTPAEKDTLKIMGQVLEALAHCHEMGIVHRDVKHANLLLDGELNVKLIDFGFAHKIRKDDSLTTLCGTRGYFAPEMISSYIHEEEATGYVLDYRFEVDAYACGVMLYDMLVGYMPFDIDDVNYFFNVQESKYWPLDDPEWDRVSPNAKDLVARLLALDPSERLTPSKALQLPIFKLQEEDEEEKTVKEALLGLDKISI